MLDIVDLLRITSNTPAKNIPHSTTKNDPNFIAPSSNWHIKHTWTRVIIGIKLMQCNNKIAWLLFNKHHSKRSEFQTKNPIWSSVNKVFASIQFYHWTQYLLNEKFVIIFRFHSRIFSIIRRNKTKWNSSASACLTFCGRCIDCYEFKRGQQIRFRIQRTHNAHNIHQQLLHSRTFTT